MDGMFDSIPWGWVVVLGPVILGIALFWGMTRSRKADRRIDPGTPSDDPSKGMPGHD